MRRGVAVLLVVASAACFGTVGVLTLLAYEHGARPLPILAWRFAIAAAAMAGYLALVRPSALRIRSGDLGRFALLSVTGYGAASLCFFFALQHASASVVAVLLYTYPALIAAAEALDVSLTALVYSNPTDDLDIRITQAFDELAEAQHDFIASRNRVTRLTSLAQSLEQERRHQI